MFHDRPVLFQEFVFTYLGQLNYESLKVRATAIKKWRLDELRGLLDVINKELEE